MKILLLAARVPAAEQKGDQSVSFHRAMYLARYHTVEVICFGDAANTDDRTAKACLNAAGIAVHFVKWNAFVACAQLLLAIPDSLTPFQCAFFRSLEFRKAVDSAIFRLKPDSIYCIMIRILPNLAHHDVPLYVDMIDSMGLNFARRLDVAKGPMYWLLKLESSRVASFERRAARHATRSFVVSKIDQAFIGEGCVDVIPLGVDLRRFSQATYRSVTPIIVFSGNMSYQPNVDAVSWFVRHCWAEVKSKVEDIRLLIVGSQPAPSVVSLGSNDDAIEVLGRVQSVADVLRRATVAIAPMQSGSGMQFKILEAMACGVPVVATTIGLGDISATPGKHLLVVDSPAEFSQSLISLFESNAIARSIGDQGKCFVESCHDWDSVNRVFAIACGIERSGCS